MGTERNLVLDYEVYIAAPLAKVWQALVDGDITRHYLYGSRLTGKIEKGAPYAYLGEGDFKAIEGEILEAKPKAKLVMTWHALWDESVAKDRPSRVTYEVSENSAAVTKLHVVHDEFRDKSATREQSVHAWPVILSSLKTFLETGKPLNIK